MHAHPARALKSNPASQAASAHAPNSLQRAGLSNQALLRLQQGSGEPLGPDSDMREAALALPLQRKATSGSADDPLEQEAERAADQVLRMPDNPAISLGASRQISRKCDGGCDETEGKLQFKRAAAAPPSGAPAHVGQVLSSPGRPLDAATRAFMEPRFGHDFGHVRVHTSEAAARSADAVAAQAYTVGSAVVFGSGRYAPHTTQGRHLLSHELTHVVQQQVRGPALQRREANCPAAPPSPPTIATMADFIEMVKRVEASSPTGSDPVETARIISRTKYDGRAWDWMLPSTKGQAGVQESASGVGKVLASDLASLCFKLIVSLPGGGQEDPMHVIVAIVADAETKPAGTGASGLSQFVDPLPKSVSQRGATTWVGDVGKAAAYWTFGIAPAGGGSTKEDQMQDDAPPHDLMADVDGVAMTSKTAGAGWAFDKTKPLSENLQNFYNPATHKGRERRFHVFCDAESFALEADGITLSGAAKTAIGDKVRDFASWMEKNDPTILLRVGIMGKDLGFATQLIKRADDWKWFADQFIKFVQDNLNAEGP